MGVQQNLLHYLTFAGLCALVVNGNEGVRWCVISTGEESKCQAFAKAIESHGLHLNCVKKTSHAECITAIDENKADAVTLDGGDIFNAGKSPHYLQPIAGENYGPDVGTCYFAVAVAHSSSSFGFDGLKGKKSCHTGMGKSTGWNLPIGALLESGTLTWEGPSVEPIQQAVSRFFKESCVPGAKDIPGLSVVTKTKLCQLCKGQGENFCVKNTHEPYYGYHGAFSCLKDNVGEVAFVKHITVKEETTDDERNNYQLLCPDGSRAAVSEFKDCHLAYVAAHAVVARNGDANDQKTRAAILALLYKAENLFGVQGSHKDIFELFSSSKFSGANLMFKDSTVSLFHLPEGLDYRGYLGNKYVTAVESLIQNKETKALRWCCIGESEKQKCDAWDPSKKKLQCVSSYSVEKCIWKIKVGEADVMSLDGGLIYTAGKCGLVPVMSEYYSTDDTCAHPDTSKTSGKYYAVAVVRKNNHDINLLDLAGKSTCHTGVNRTAGWNVPIGRLVKMGKIPKCDIVRAASNYFGPGCAPGAPLNSNLCKKCVGSGVDTVGHPDPHKCESSSSERYSGYSGAFRCMAEGAGDVAFVKHLTVPENTDGANPAPWANNLKSSDFELLCDDGTRAPITDYLKCNLALSPAHAVFSRLEMKERVHDFLLKSQKKYGHGGPQENTFSMFSSADYVGKDLLFKDSTQCLVSIETNNYKYFLGAYFDSMEGLNACAPSELIETCEFDVCHIPKKV